MKKSGFAASVRADNTNSFFWFERKVEMIQSWTGAIRVAKGNVIQLQEVIHRCLRVQELINLSGNRLKIEHITW